MSFNFGSLATAPASDFPSTFGELFKQLDRKATHTSLRPTQLAALEALDSQIEQRDVIMKLSTGSGKTVVGLVYAEMMRRRYKGEPVVYLCPTTQLVDQVVASGQAIGVPVSTFARAGFPYGALSGESVLACTYDKLFTGGSVFESKSIRPSAIVFDDIHAGVERIKKYFTTPVPQECYPQLRSLLKPLCESTDAATWAGISTNDPGSTYEVPYWVWASVSKEVAAMLEIESRKEDSKLFFTWKNVARYIELARCCISGVAAEIALQVPPVEEVAAYEGAKHRLFMSASIKDTSALVSVLGCDPNAYTRWIEPKEDEGSGERMILPTSLIDPESKKPEIAIACALLAKETNVVVLTSSAAQAKAWMGAGALLSQNKDFDVAIERLKTSTGNYLVFAQRFDGVDLPDDACRVLVIDGIPSGDRIVDHVDAYRQKDSPEYEVRTVNKFEQALGRAVRSSADYAAVLLVGPDIAAFIGRKSVQAIFEERTRLQVDLGRELAQKAGKGRPIAAVIAEMAQALLLRNEGWKDAHRARVKVEGRQPRPAALTPFEAAAVGMREAWNFAKAQNFQAAVARLRDASNAPELHRIQKAELLYWVAAYLHHFDPAAAAEAYKAVFSINSKFPRPEKVADRKFARVTDQAVAICSIFSTFVSANAAIARLDEVKAKVSFGNPAETVEQGLHELGELAGATSNRPEKETGRGPDVLWLFDDCGACIEAKSEKTAPIHKSDAAQLALSMTWCEEALTSGTPKPAAVFATNVSSADRAEDVSFGPKLLSEKSLMEIVEGLRKLVLSLTFDGPLFTDPATVGKKLNELGISGRAILARLPVLKG
jgi:hypothetical protein